MPTAKGTFEVKTAPLPPDEATAATAIGRFSLDKSYLGDLEAATVVNVTINVEHPDCA